MNDLLRDFLSETGEQLDAVRAELVRFEQNPADARGISYVFGICHAIKAASGFLNLPRLERVAHSLEILIGRLRDGVAATPHILSLTVAALDRIGRLLRPIAKNGVEPDGDDDKLIAEIQSASATVAQQSDIAGAAPPEDALSVMLSRVGAPTSLDVPQLLSGASVLGDGSIVLVLDPAGIVAALRREPAVGVTQAVDALDLELKRFPAKTSAREAFGGTARRSRALVVETRHFFLDMIGAALHTAGFEADLALGGDEALVRLRANGPYDLVLVPMDLPGVDPAGLARLVGDARPELGAAVVGLAAHGGPIPQRDARAAGMRCAVGRFDRAALLRAVAAATAPALEIAA